MLQQRKKDYLQRIIEEFFAKLDKLLAHREEGTSLEDQKKLLDDCFQFFNTNFETKSTDTSEELINKIDSYELSEQYAKLLLTSFEITQPQTREVLDKALLIIESITKSDTTYSWDREILREDILRLLDRSQG